MAGRPTAARARRHQDCAGQHGRRFEQNLLPVPLPRSIDWIHQSIERHLAHDESAKASALVDGVRIPLAENIVRTAIGGMPVVVSTRIDSELLQRLEVKAGLVKSRGVRLLEN